MKTKNMILVGAAMTSLLAGCALTPIALNPVGPAPDMPNQAACFPTGGLGQLRVYTATKVHEIGDDTYFYAHTGYRICTKDGQLWKLIPNHTDNTDEAASLVQIPAGDYRIFARSEAYNLVSVPVVIQAGKTTEVHLGTHWQAPSNIPADELVFLPDGYPVGWRSSNWKFSQ
jgi:hypothetical protein